MGQTWTIWCDGSGTTGGPAGIGFVARSSEGHYWQGNLALANATNQQAELLAAAFALVSIPAEARVTVISDSRYVVDGYKKIFGWRDAGWRRPTGAVANVNHWKRLISAAENHEHVEFEWVRGHDACDENNEADRLAVEARAEAKRQAASA